jgi:hypothetical protein
MRMKYLVGTIFWLLIGIITIIKGYQLGLGQVNKPGPGFIFFLAALLLIILSIVDLIGISPGKELRTKKRRKCPFGQGFNGKRYYWFLGYY